jgi:hypothetical protein
MKLTLGLYGLFLLMVAIQGNAQKLATQVTSDMGGFLPWLIVFAALGLLYDYEPTHDIATLFIILAVLSFVLKNISNLKSTFGTIYSNATTTTAAPLTTSSLAGTA